MWGLVVLGLRFEVGLLVRFFLRPFGAVLFLSSSFHGLRVAFGVASPVATGLRPFGAVVRRGGGGLSCWGRPRERVP